ncbi:MAG: extracellular solute-binding protein [Thermomicrobiales bacterium]
MGNTTAPADHHRIITRRSFAGVLGALGAAGVMRNRRAARASDRTTVTVWTWQDGVAVKALEDAASSFDAAQNDVHVEVVRRPAVYSTFQLLNTIRDGIGPDLAIGDRGLLAERDANGICDDLAPYLANANPAIDLDRDFLPFAAQEVRLGDRVLGIPLETSVRVLAVNRLALASAGVGLAEWSPDRGPVTFDRLAEVAQGLDRKNADGFYEQLGFLPGFGEGSVYRYLHAWGAGYFDEAQCAFTVDNPEAVSAATWVRAYGQHFEGSQLDEFLMRNGGVDVPAGTAFLRGELAFALVRGEDLAAIAQLKPGFELGATFIQIPATGAPSRSWATGNAISLMTGAKHPEEAARFATYLASADVLDRYGLAIGSLPSRKQPSPEVLKGLALPSFIPDNVLPGAVGTPHVPIASQFGDLLVQAWSDTTSGAVDIASGFADLQAQANQDLADAGLCA